MDDIKRPKPTRPQVALSMHRRSNRHALVAGRAHNETPVAPKKSRKFFLLIDRYIPSRRKHPAIARIGWAGVAAVMLLTVFIGVLELRRSELQYQLSPEAEALIGPASPVHAESLKLDAQVGVYEYNKGYQPGGDIAGQSARPKFTASFNTLPEEGTTVTDPVNETSVTFKPDFGLEKPVQQQNRLVYPLKKGDGAKVYSLKSTGFKEDIILNSFQGDTLTFKYNLELARGTEARMESDGSLAIYGVAQELLGSVSTGSSKDEALLKKARENGEKSNLLFRFPAPFVVESGKKRSDAKAWFRLKANELTVHAAQLKGASYPLSVDPSVYVETAAKLMRGNNETNIDFDVDGELIQKGSTTGARFDEWTNTMALNEGRWNGGTAVAGGNMYQVGGMETGGTSMPTVAGQQITTTGTVTNTFTMNMPASRPAGDLYIAVMAHDGTGVTVSPAAGSNWQEYADTGEHAAYWKIGEDKGGGNEQSTYQWTKSGATTEEWAGAIVRITGFDPADPISGTPTTNSSGTNGNPVAPSVTPDQDSTLILRAAGVDDDDPTGSWQPSGHTQVAGQRSSAGTGSASFVLASMNTPPTAGNPSGTATFSGFSDTWGSSSIAINPQPGATSVSADVTWAHFNTSSTRTVDSPNPGDGSCSGWCTDAAYSLPDERAGLSLVAYNGFLYAMGGVDSGGTKQSTVYVAKLGVNGEPARWHPTDLNKDNWVYWYPSTSLSSARSYTAAVAYNNRMYLLGGLTTGDTTVSTVEYANINPTGTLSSWSSTGMTALPTARYGHTAHIYNDRMYLIGGNTTLSGSPLSTVHYIKINTDGTMSGSWQSANGFSTGRMTWGGGFATVWGGYVYLSGGCSAVNTSGYCTTIEDSVQLASINADGSLASWGSILDITNERIGYSLVAWRNTLYRVGGCSAQNTSNGSCTTVLDDVDLGIINPDGDASTVATSEPSGTSPCNGGSPFNCDLPGTASIGNMLSATAIMNGYLYIVGGCTNVGCTTATGNTAYVAIASDGSLTRPASCTGGSFVDSYCVDSTGPISGGALAAGTAVFNGRIYLVGGQSSGALKDNIYYVAVNDDGSLNGGWNTQTFASIGATSVSYTFAYARANPASASTNPGNLYIFGGCSGDASGAGCPSGSNTQNVYKCNITTSGAIGGSSCTTSGQLQIGTVTGASSPGLAIHAGTVYANYIYLIGGVAPGITDLTTVRYAKFDNNNNIVAASGSAWVESANEMSIGRRRGASFGYNGYIYVVGGYDGTGGGGVLSDIQYAKVNVSDGSIGVFRTSGVTINQRWGLSVPVSNSYAFVIGGCINGASPSCSTATNDIQTFQVYNNDSGTAANYTSGANLFATDRVGASAAILDGYIYVAGGCTTVANDTCTAATDNVQYASLDAYGAIGSWSNTTDATLPGQRAFGQLEAAGGTLYYIGGQGSTATDESLDVFYGTPSSGNVSSWSTATNSLPAARTQHSAAVWNNRIYVTGGLDGSAADTTTVYASPSLANGGNITSSWTATGMTAFNVARSGHTTVAYANNLYIFGGYDGANYLSDSQFAQIKADGTVGSWTYTTSLPRPVRQGDGFAANGYMYLLGGRSTDTNCRSSTLVAPISANTAIDPDDVGGTADDNLPTGIGEWYETNVRYSGNRYGAGAVYDQGKVYLLGGACTSQTAPAVASVTPTNTGTGFATDSLAHAVLMPGTTAPGDLLLMLFSTDDNATVTDPDGAGGWTQQATQTTGAGGVRGSVWAKVATGSEGVSATFSTSSSQSASAQVYRILAADWNGDLSSGVAAVAGTGSTTQNPNPPSLDPSAWDIENTLWIAYSAGGTYTSVTTYPANYTNGAHHAGNTSTNGASTSSARRELTVASEDPGTFTMDASNPGVPFTVAVRPGIAYTGANRVVQTAVLSQPQVAKYSRMIDTDSDVFPTKWLLNGIDNSIGARWAMRYRTMNDSDGVATDCGTADMTTWGQETNFGNVTLGQPENYTPLGGSGVNINCARFFYMSVTIDSSQSFGYPEDISRGPTIADLSLFFTSDPSKRLRHGKTFTGGEQQPLDTPF